MTLSRVLHRAICFKKARLSGKITTVKLPRFHTQPVTGMNPTAKTNKHVTATKQVALAQCTIDIAKQWGKTLESSPLFDSDPTVPWCTKPDKLKLVAELKKHLAPQDFVFNPAQVNTDVIMDFMSKIRQYPDLSIFNTSGQAIRGVFVSTQNRCQY